RAMKIFLGTTFRARANRWFRSERNCAAPRHRWPTARAAGDRFHSRRANKNRRSQKSAAALDQHPAALGHAPAARGIEDQGTQSIGKGSAAQVSRLTERLRRAEIV